MAPARTEATRSAYRQPARAYEAVLRPVRQGNAFEETVERLLQVIRLGVVPVGERLPPERDLALRLGVSRATVREAISALQRAGFAEPRRGRYGGTFVLATPGPVRPPDIEVDHLEDSLVLRHVVEVGATEQAAARNLGPDEVEHLLGILAATSTAAPSEYRRADSRLHLALAELSGCPSLTAAVADARARVNGLLDAIPLLEVNIRHSDAQHRRIVSAVLADAPEMARLAMAEHVEGTAALLRGFLG